MLALIAILDLPYTGSLWSESQLNSATVFSSISIVRPRDCTSGSIIKYNFASNQCTVLECMVQCKNGMVWCLLFPMQRTVTRMVRDPILWPSNHDILPSMHPES